MLRQAVGKRPRPNLRLSRSLPARMGMAAIVMALASAAHAADEALDETWSLHGQSTFTVQFHPAFTSPYRGDYSLDPGSRGNETFDATLFAGVRLWSGSEFYVNPEIEQGFGLSGTLGLAGFSSGEAYKIGKSSPYARLQRLFLRQTFDLGGDSEAVAPAANQLGGTRTADNLVITMGKFSAIDIFDTNSYAHDARSDFLNWAMIESGSYDYAADSWGYSYGLASEWTQHWWTWRIGLFNLSRRPNSAALERGFGQFELVTEGEARHTLWGEPGKIKLLAFINRGRMGAYDDAVRLAEMTGQVPDTALVRHYASRPGMALNLEQAISGDLGMFLRASLADGSKEIYEFTEIDRGVSTGLSLKGSAWARPDDTVGMAFAINGLSTAARRYFAAGGHGLLIGDGQLPHYGNEDIFETYYQAQLASWLFVTADYQFVAHPAYNPDRGPVSIFALRLHAGE